MSGTDRASAADHSITAQNGREYKFRRLSRAERERHADRLVEIHNLIPYVNWEKHDLLAYEDSDGNPYLGSDELSFGVFSDGRPVGLLVAYLRSVSARHPLESVYIHRLAIAEEHQNQGIGTTLVGFAITRYFSSLPWLLTVTSQTNDEPQNSGVLAFYGRLGFRSCYSVSYPDKQDLLMEVSRSSWWRMPEYQAEPEAALEIDLAGTTFGDRSPQGPPTVYFGSGSKDKLIQYRYLFRCFGMNVRRLKPVAALSTEPQVEGYGSGPEAALVAEPLKWFSRFAALGDTYPAVVEDTMLFIEHFNDEFDSRPMLPGADTKRWWAALGNSGVLRIMSRSRRRRAKYVCQIGVNIGPRMYATFRAELPGRIADEERASDQAVQQFPYTNATYFHRIFIPDGLDATLAELGPREFLGLDYRRRCLEAALTTVRKAAEGAEATSQSMLFEFDDDA